MERDPHSTAGSGGGTGEHTDVDGVLDELDEPLWYEKEIPPEDEDPDPALMPPWAVPPPPGPGELRRRRERQLRHRAELALASVSVGRARRPADERSSVAVGVRPVLLEMRDEAVEELLDVDTGLVHLLARRRALVERVRAIERSMDSPTARARKQTTVHSSSLEPRVPPATREVHGGALRRELLELLASADGPLSVEELRQLLAMSGFAVRGRPSRAISDALAVECRAGRVDRCSRGRYVWIAETVCNLPID